jgi:hypothetical protein
MLQESTQVQWDPINIDRPPSKGLEIYLLFLLIACVMTVPNLVRVWRSVPPFSSKSPAFAAAYCKVLQISANRFRRWIGLIFLASGLLTTTAVYDTCSALLLEKRPGLAAVVPVIQDFSATLCIGLLVVLFLYLARWHIRVRLERFHD